MPRQLRPQPAAVGEALTRALDTGGAKLPARFTEEPTKGMESSSRTFTDTESGRSCTSLITCVPTVRRVLQDLFPDG